MTISEIVMQIVIQTDSNLLKKAVEIQHNPLKLPETIYSRVYKSYCSPEQQEEMEKEGKSYLLLELKPLQCNPFRIYNPYLVKLPNGSIDWVKDETN